MSNPDPTPRDKSHLWQKGTSANPGGRSKIQRALQSILDEAAPDAVARICKLVNSEDETVGLAAAKDIVDRVLGRAKVRDDDGKPVDAIALAILELARAAKAPE